jgi:carotenoid cleavage dioxygenase-like enzyme
MNGTSQATMPAQSRFLKGPFAPVTEEITAVDLPITGRLPDDLNGSYFRNGPNPMGLDDPNYHWFVGAGMVHGVRLRDGRAEWYRNRWVRSQSVAEALKEKWAEGPVHEADVPANTHILAHAGRILATIEGGPLPYQMSNELDTLGPCDFAGTLPGGFAAHTKADARTGELHAIAYSFRCDNVDHIVIDRDGKVSRITNIKVADQPMMHDFAITEKYVVVYDLPVTFSMDAARDGRKLPYSWNAAHEARIGLLRRDGNSADVRWIGIDPCFVFHTLNAYDENDKVVVDVCRYEGAYDVSMMTGRGPVTLYRWIVDPAAGTADHQCLDDHFQEFPRVDSRTIGRPHRYGYSTAIDQLKRAIISPSGDFSDDTLGNVLFKHDLATGTVTPHSFGRGAAAGEAVFVPASPDGAEDDGYVMAFVHDFDRGATDLAILAAQDFSSEPVARIHLPVWVPLGFHGNWIANTEWH